MTAKRTRRLKNLDNFKVGKITVENADGVVGRSRPATKAEIANVANSFFAALSQGNVTVNGKPVDPVTGKIGPRRRR